MRSMLKKQVVGLKLSNKVKNIFVFIVNKQIKNHYKKIILVVIFIWYLFFSLPSKLFNYSTSTVLFDAQGELLAAKLAADEQWRFSEIDSVPGKFEKCLLQFEDAYFYKHPGFNPISIGKAAITNIKAKKIVRGGSTITMQTIRLARNKKRRSLYEKVVELILATRLELRYSKKEILRKYVSNTPYGGNIVGLPAAAWRYYGRSPYKLSWGESAMLAVLPNAPSLLYPGKNHDKLKDKRDRLLTKLWRKQIIDSTTCFLAQQEVIPNKPKRLPNDTQHLLHRIAKSKRKGKQIITTLNKRIQETTVAIIERNLKLLRSNHIYNSACIVVEVESGEVISYVGNSKNATNNQGKDVDIIMSPRSTGSILKPILYALAIEDGTIMPKSLLADIPTQIAGYSPQNYNKTYDGAVPADIALARSLNIPAVRLLRDYKYPLFHEKLRELGITTLKNNANHYGLSLILGGAEANLWELTGLYASFARSVQQYSVKSSLGTNLHVPKIVKEKQKGKAMPVNTGALYLMFQAMLGVNRPVQEAGWEYYAKNQKIAWKTGTSFGNRDAWAIGLNNKYAVGIWVGNADGEGRAALTGINSAAPILFDIFKQFDTSQWYNPPYEFLREVKACKRSGYRASKICPETTTVLVPKAGERSAICNYHKKIHLSADGAYQVNSSCEKPHKMLHKSWFVLPPVMEWYYKKKNSDYEVLPPLKPNCDLASRKVMEVIYPKKFSKLFIPREINGKKGVLIFKAAHTNPDTTIFWHIDSEYVGATEKNHELSVQPNIGIHVLTLVDSQGNKEVKKFEVVE